MTSTAAMCLIASGIFLLLAMLIGVWKYRAMLSSPDHRAPVYVDIAHRASLMYSFASIVLMLLAEHGGWPETVRIWATGVPILLFFAAVAGYLTHAFKEDTDNQFRERNFATTWGMYILITGEILGVAVLLAGVILNL